MSSIEQALRKMKEAAAQQGTSPASRQSAPREVVSSMILAPTAEVQILGRPFEPSGPVSITINREQLRRYGVLPSEAEARRVSMEFRNIKRALLASVAGRGGSRTEDSNAIMVASALSGEGKTFTTVNLALSLAAEKDWNVVLVDGDVAKPQLSTLMGLKNERGLLDFLTDHAATLEEFCAPTDVPGLSILPAGTQSELATELLSSVRAGKLVESFRRYSSNTIFLFDSPPVLMTSEAKVLADAVGQVVLVVRADSTPRQAVVDAVAALGTGRPISLLLNQFVGKVIGSDYYARYDKMATLPTERT